MATNLWSSVTNDLRQIETANDSCVQQQIGQQKGTLPTSTCPPLPLSCLNRGIGCRNGYTLQEPAEPKMNNSSVRGAGEGWANKTERIDVSAYLEYVFRCDMKPRRLRH